MLYARCDEIELGSESKREQMLTGRTALTWLRLAL